MLVFKKEFAAFVATTEADIKAIQKQISLLQATAVADNATADRNANAIATLKERIDAVEANGEGAAQLASVSAEYAQREKASIRLECLKMSAGTGRAGADILSLALEMFNFVTGVEVKAPEQKKK